MRYIKLKTEDIEVLESLQKSDPSNMVRKRSQCLLLSHQNHKIIELTKIFDVNRRTIERWFTAWENDGVKSLPIQPGRGVKTRLKGFEDDIAEQMKIHNRNLKNVLTHLKEQHKITICKKTLQNFLKDTGL